MLLSLSQIFRRSISNVPLRWVLTILFVLPTIGAVVIVGYLSYRNGQEVVEDLGERLVAETNERVKQELEAYLQIPVLINRLNVDAVAREQLDLQNIPALEAALFSRLQQFEQVAAVLFASPQGRFRLVDRLPDLYLVAADPPRPDRILIYSLNGDGSRRELVHTNQGLDVRRDRSWYRRAVTTGKPGWSPISQYGSLDFLTLDASHPVYEPTTKNLLGVFAVHIRLDYLSEFLHRLEISRFGRVIIIERNGNLIATSTREKAYKFEAGKRYQRQFEQINIDESRDDLTRSLGKYLFARADILKSDAQTHFLNFRYDGEPQFVKIMPLQDRYGLDWQIVTVIPKSHFLRDIKENSTRTTALLCLLTLGVAIALGLIATNKITARLKELNCVSGELAAGNLERRLPTNSPIYELNSLARSFNQMADRLQQSFKRIQIALEESEEKFATIFRTSPDPMVIASLAEGRILEANNSQIEFFGYSRAETLGCTSVELNFWSNLDERERFRTLLQRQRRSRNFEAQFRIKSGELRTVLVSAEVLTLEEQDCAIVVLRDISERKQAEAALQESETRFRQLAESVREGFFVYETQSERYSYVNPAYAAIMATPVQSFYQGMFHWLANIHPQDRDRIEAGLGRERQGENFDEQYRFFRPNGELRWLHSKAFPLQDKTGAIVRIVGTVADITERKLFEFALQSSEAKLSNLLGSANASIASFRLFPDRHWEYDYWSEGCEKVFGYTAQELLAEPTLWFSRVFSEDIERGWVANFESLMTDCPTTTQGEYRFFHKNGSLRWASFQATSRLNGTEWIVTVVDIDISERKQTEETLRENEELVRRAFDDSPIGIALFSPTGQFLKANTYYCDLLEYTEEELLTLTFQDITHPADLKADLNGFSQIMAGEIPSYNIEKRYITKQGIVVPVLLNAASIRGRDQRPLYCVGQIQDIRDRLKVERMKDEFISVVSHELRTPLTSIRGALGILGSNVFNNRPEKAQHMLQIAINNSTRLVRLVNDILSLERLESGKVQLVMEQCQVVDLMQQAVDSVRPLAERAEIVLALTPISVNLWAAPDAIVQTFINLLSNAIKFSLPRDTVWLEAKIANKQWATGSGQQFSDAQTHYILFTVKDRGRGIPEDKLEIIFDQFQQVDVSDSYQKGGTGLGLAICKKIVQQHGGQIWVESRLGEGSTFYFTLPLRRKDEND